MRRHLVHFLLVALLSVYSTASALAQVTVKGQVVDSENSEPMIGAAVTVGASQGTVTDLDGNFTINVAPNVTITIKYLGFKEVKKKITGRGQVDLGVIQLEVDAYALDDVVITQSLAVARKTPVAITTLDPVFIDERLGMQDFPELMKMTPSIYVSKAGGGFGDTEIVMRGFKKENVAVMVNGVPMNDMENGTVYWSNWTALSDVTRSKQIQRGLGASKVSAPSVGGSINVITKTIDAQKGGFVSYGMGQDGFNKLLFSVSTGLSKTGWAMTLMGGKEWGDGYIQGTEYESYSYFINIAKRINDNHQLSFTAFGSPQWHNQRNNYDGLTIQGWQEVKKYTEDGEHYRYNATYGFDKNGIRKAAQKNKYHKPQFSLNHMWQIDNTSSLSTALYVSIGDGWGHRGEGRGSYSSSNWYGVSNGVLNTTFRNGDGTFAYDQIQEINETSENGSQMVMTASVNGHQWYGLLSTYTKELNENINFYAGIDGRYYIGRHTNKIVDLYGGDYYVDTYRSVAAMKAENNSAAASANFKNEKLVVGDVVRRNFEGHVLQGGLFGQIEYSNDLLSSFVSASVSHTEQWRYGKFYYDKAHAKSETVGKMGFTVKGGANYNLNDNHNVYANVGFISRAPYLDGGIFLSLINSNAINKDAVNEKVFSVELGYGYQSKFMNVNLNAYHTKWMDKTMARSNDISTQEGYTDRALINMQGVDATHQGVELEFKVKPIQWLDVKGMFSIGNWRWSNNPVGYWYNSSGEPLKNSKGEIASGIGAEDHAKSTLMLEDIKVGYSAQTTASLGVDIKPVKNIRLSLDWNFQGRLYADYTLTNSSLSMGDNVTFANPWRVPSSSTFDLSASYSFNIGNLRSTLSGNVSNLFDQEYIQSARNGGDGTWQSAYVFYGFGRRMSVKLKVNF